ncbi:ABC transporter permease [Lagierella sp.]|uniref:ABC transporter permease n=1 Tax=Lagierella sp. TaxID=2849657 RepID=UPI00262CE4E6|nr:ABC transporter permease [Lagierella sp.]
MNKKNFPIFISLFIVSLFFTLVFYYGYTNLKSNYEYYMSSDYYHAQLDKPFNREKLDKLKSVDKVKYAGLISIKPTSGKYKNDLIAVDFQDGNVNQMREYSEMIEGRFPKNEKEIVLSKGIVEKYKLKINDKLKIDLGKRTSDGVEIEPRGALTDKETFITDRTEEFELVGVYENIYNKYSRISYGLVYKEDIDPGVILLKFDSFEEGYKNRKLIQKDISEKLGEEVSMVISPSLINYYGVEFDFPHNILAKAVNILSVIGCIALFVFFIKNIFKVWGLRKTRELSIYKSIGTTNFQIFLLLLKEGIIISVIPILLGHLAGFGFMSFLYRTVQESQEVSKFEKLTFNPILSLIIILVSFIVVFFAIRSPARIISKINIIDGIKGNIDLNKYKKKRDKKLWRELKLNNLASIKSHRYISAMGIIIISVFIIIFGMAKYYRDFAYYDTGNNIFVDYYSEENKVPKILQSIKEDLPNDKAYISKSKYISVKNNLELSGEAKAVNLEKDIDKTLKRYETDELEGRLIALEYEDFKSLGGKKGEFILYNMVQEDASIPISKAKLIPYFEKPDSMEISIGEDFSKEIKISRTINNLGQYDSVTFPLTIKLYTDFDTYFNLMEEARDEAYKRYPYELSMKVRDFEIDEAKDYADQEIKKAISPNDNYYIVTEEEREKLRTTDLESLVKIVIGIGTIIFLLNVTNGYSSINLSLMNRKKEIGTLYSCGMNLKDVESAYLKEFVSEQVKSFILSIGITLVVMFVLGLLVPTIEFKNLLDYYNYWLFLGFAMVVYIINIGIYYFSLRRILNKPTIELIK